MIDRKPSHNIESEQSVLGGLMLQPDAIDQIADILTPSMFFVQDHREIYGTILSMIQAGAAVDVITVAEAFDARKQLDEIGGIAYLSELAQNTPSAANIKHYAQIVADRSIDRALVQVAAQIDEIAGSGDPVIEKVDRAQSCLSVLAERSTPAQTETAREATIKAITALQERHDNGGRIGRSTGLVDLDNALGGIRDGNLIVIAGRPSMGKTALAMQIAENVSDDEPAFVASLEMPTSELISRSIASASRVPVERLLTAEHLTDDEWQFIAAATGRIAEKKLHILDASELTVMQLRAHARRVKRQQCGLGLVVVDYLQLMSFDSSKNEVEGLAGISRGLKLLAKELKCPVIALSQLSRECEKRPNKRPLMSDLRASGAIEQDADVVIMVYRDEVYNSDTPYKGTAELLIRKNRNGALRDVWTTFIGERTRFECMAGRPIEPIEKPRYSKNRAI